MITVLYGKSVISLTYDVFATKYTETADSGELSTQDTETEKDSTHKSCKKACPEMDYGQAMITLHSIPGESQLMLGLGSCFDLPTLFQKVPTQPPLVCIA